MNRQLQVPPEPSIWNYQILCGGKNENENQDSNVIPRLLLLAAQPRTNTTNNRGRGCRNDRGDRRQWKRKINISWQQYSDVDSSSHGIHKRSSRRARTAILEETESNHATGNLWCRRTRITLRQWRHGFWMVPGQSRYVSARSIRHSRRHFAVSFCRNVGLRVLRACGRYEFTLHQLPARWTTQILVRSRGTRRTSLALWHSLNTILSTSSNIVTNSSDTSDACYHRQYCIFLPALWWNQCSFLSPSKRARVF